MRLPPLALCAGPLYRLYSHFTLFNLRTFGAPHTFFRLLKLNERFNSLEYDFQQFCLLYFLRRKRTTIRYLGCRTDSALVCPRPLDLLLEVIN